MLAYLGAVWRCRYFWLSLVRMDLRTRYRGSVLGMGWSLLHPIAMTIILCVVFRTIFDMDVKFFAPYLMAGLAFWAYVQTVSLQGCHSFYNAQAYIRQFPAPMAIYPLRTVLGSAFHLCIALLLALCLTWAFLGLPRPLVLLALVPVLLLLLALGWALATLFGLATVRFRDLHHLSEIGLQGLFYLTPVMYPPHLLTGRGRLAMLMRFNPLMPFLNLLRTPILDGALPDPSDWLAAGLIVLAAVGVAALALWQEERRIIFHL
jgi:ABC-type polysaccharide/polyol phosphate export permease